MLEIQKSRSIVTYTQKWFSAVPMIGDSIRLVMYTQSRFVGIRPGFARKPFFTKLVNLGIGRGELLDHCEKKTRYEINRADRDGTEFTVEGDLEKFVEFYNLFADSKGLRRLRRREFIQQYGPHVIVTKAVHGNVDLVMHCYLIDRDVSRVRLLRSASLHRLQSSSADKSLIGRANRFLHYRDMLYFKGNGFRVYDLGGYAHRTDDPVLRRINDFKDGFGGELVEESHFISLPLLAGIRVAHVKRRLVRN